MVDRLAQRGRHINSSHGAVTGTGKIKITHVCWAMTRTENIMHGFGTRHEFGVKTKLDGRGFVVDIERCYIWTLEIPDGKFTWSWNQLIAGRKVRVSCETCEIGPADSEHGVQSENPCQCQGRAQMR